MTPALRLVGQVDPSPLSAAAPSPRERSWEVWLALGAVGVATALWIAAPEPGRRALELMASPERAQLFDRTRSNVAALCQGAPALREHCRNEVQLLLSFPECGDACRGLASAAWPGPTR